MKRKVIIREERTGTLVFIAWVEGFPEFAGTGNSKLDAVTALAQHLADGVGQRAEMLGELTGLRQTVVELRDKLPKPVPRVRGTALQRAAARWARKVD